MIFQDKKTDKSSINRKISIKHQLSALTVRNQQYIHPNTQYKAAIQMRILKHCAELQQSPRLLVTDIDIAIQIGGKNEPQQIRHKEPRACCVRGKGVDGVCEYQHIKYQNYY